MTETKTPFTIYKIFNDEGLAYELTLLLRKHNIRFTLEKDTSDIPFMGTNPLNYEFRVLMDPHDFSKADKLLTDAAASEIDSIDKDYYLFGFTDEELMEVVEKNDEWSKIDYLLALKILKERGQEVDLAKLSALKEERATELAKPEEEEVIWIYVGYVFALIGGALGILIGYYMMTIKKTLPGGEKVYVYNERYRTHGKRIFWLGLIMVAIYLTIYFRIMLKTIL